MNGIFHPGWVYHHRATANSGALARVLVTRGGTGEPTWNPVTGVTTAVPRVKLYEGSGQVQRIAFPTNRDFVEDAAKFQRMEVTLGFETNELIPLAFNIQVNDRVEVLANPSDPEKVGAFYYVHGDESSSNAWQRVLTCQTNMKQG